MSFYREQKIRLTSKQESTVRNVYDVTVNRQLKYEVGYIQYDNQSIAVWRPISEKSIKENESTADRIKPWYALYKIKVSQIKNSSANEAVYIERQIKGQRLKIPKVDVSLSYFFIKHIESQGMH